MVYGAIDLDTCDVLPDIYWVPEVKKFTGQHSRSNNSFRYEKQIILQIAPLQFEIFTNCVPSK